MTMTAVVHVREMAQTRGTLAAFAPDGSVRGLTHEPIMIPFGAYAGESCFHVLLFGSEGEQLSFRFWDGARVTPLSQTQSFESHGAAGDALAPVLLTSHTYTRRDPAT